MNLLENELIRKYFGWKHPCGHANGPTGTYIYCDACLSLNVLRAMQEPIRKGERLLACSLNDNFGNSWEETTAQCESNVAWHPFTLRLPDAAQGKECKQGHTPHGMHCICLPDCVCQEGNCRCGGSSMSGHDMTHPVHCTWAQPPAPEKKCNLPGCHPDYCHHTAVEKQKTLILREIQYLIDKRLDYYSPWFEGALQILINLAREEK